MFATTSTMTLLATGLKRSDRGTSSLSWRSRQNLLAINKAMMGKKNKMESRAKKEKKSSAT